MMATAGRKRLSVEISTFNRREVLRSVLARLARQTLSPDQFEVVISDDGSSDGTAAMVESAQKSLPYEVRWITHQHRGCGATHNAGIRECAGDLVLMLADDILPQPALLEEHVKSHARDPRPATAVVGKIEQSPELPQTGFQKGWDALLNATYRTITTTRDYSVFWVSNLSFKRAFMLDQGMFPEWPAAAGEDAELGHRLLRKGMTLVFNPKALGYHYHPVTIETVAAKMYEHGYNWHYVEAAVPDLKVRVRSENLKPSDGLGLYLRTLLKNRLRAAVLNRFTVPAVVIPLTRRAERVRSLDCLMPFLAKKIVSYHYFKGIRDYRSGRPHTQLSHDPQGKGLE
jgi:GT2 family glycosyltransferase